MALKLLLLSAAFFCLCPPGIRPDDQLPSESQCRPYIEKALKGLERAAESSEELPVLRISEEPYVERSKRDVDEAPPGAADSGESIEERPVAESAEEAAEAESEDAEMQGDAPAAESEEAASGESGEVELVEEAAASDETQSEEAEEAPEAEDESTEQVAPVAEEASEESEEETSGEVKETDEDASEEASEEVKEETAEEASEEASEEVKEETAEEASEEVKEETAEEASEEVKEETAEEASEEVKEETAEEASEEDKEEAAEESSEEAKEETAEDASAESEEAEGEENTADAEESAEAEEEAAPEVEDEAASEAEEEEAAPEVEEEAASESEEEAAPEVEEEAAARSEEEKEEMQAEEAASSEEEGGSKEAAEETSEESTEEASKEVAEEATEEAVEETAEEAAASEEVAEIESIPSEEKEALDEIVEVQEATVEETEEAPEEEVEPEAAETAEESPEEDLLLEIEIPENLRSRDHVAQILRLDADSTDSERLIEKSSDVTLRELKKLYDGAIKPLEILYKYRDLSNRHFGDPEIFSKPLVLFMGPWSGGKSSLINYLTDNEFTEWSLRTGAEPSPAYFNILMHGKEPEVLDGTQLAADWTFSGLQKFGQGLEERLRGLKLPSKLLERVNIVEIPGILEVRKQVSRVFPFNDACQWFIDRADVIFLVYDPSKLDVGPETEAILDQLKGREAQTRILLNKGDQVKPEELMRVQSALIWNISPLMSSAQPPVMYTTSLWSMPYEVGAPARLLLSQEKAFLKDLRVAIDRRVENKIASARRFAVRVRNHAKMVDCYLTTYYNHKTIFANKKVVAEAIVDHPQNYHIYEGLSTLTNISRYDLPDPETYADFFKLNPLYEFQQLSATCTYFRGCPINRLDVAIAYDLPELVGKYKKTVESATPQGMPKS